MTTADKKLFKDLDPAFNQISTLCFLCGVKHTKTTDCKPSDLINMRRQDKEIIESQKELIKEFKYRLLVGGINE